MSQLEPKSMGAPFAIDHLPLVSSSGLALGEGTGLARLQLTPVGEVVVSLQSATGLADVGSPRPNFEDLIGEEALVTAATGTPVARLVSSLLSCAAVHDAGYDLWPMQVEMERGRRWLGGVFS